MLPDSELLRWRWIRALLLPLTILAWLALAVLAFWLLSHVTRAIMILVLAGIVAYAITPLVNLFARWLPRPLATAFAYVIGFCVVLGFVSFIAITAAGQVTTLVHRLPAYIRDAQHLEPQVAGLLGTVGITADQLNQLRGALLARAQDLGTRAAGGALGTVQAVASGIFDAILVLILSVYLTVNGHRIGAWLRKHGTVGRAYRAETLIPVVNQVVGGYVRGTLTLASLVGFLVGTGMWVLQLPYAILLGVVAFFMEFIPVVGVLVSGVLCVAVALTQGWLKALLVLGYFVIVHLIEGDLIGPRIMSRAIGIHPAVALFALAAGTELFGVWGALFGAPIAGLIQGLVVAFWRELRRSELTGVVDEPKIAGARERKR